MGDGTAVEVGAMGEERGAGRRGCGVMGRTGRGVAVWRCLIHPLSFLDRACFYSVLFHYLHASPKGDIIQSHTLPFSLL